MAHLLLLGIRQRLTQENRFLFRNKYGLFHGFILLIVEKFSLSHFPNFHCKRSGVTKSWHFIPEAELFQP